MFSYGNVVYRRNDQQRYVCDQRAQTLGGDTLLSGLRYGKTLLIDAGLGVGNIREFVPDDYRLFPSTGHSFYGHGGVLINEKDIDGDVMEKIVEALLLWVKKNLKSPKLYITVFVLIVVFVIFFPYIDANFLFYGRIEKRISILQDISTLDMEKINEVPALESEYQSILSEITEQRDFSLFGGFSSSGQTTFRIRLNKFISGGSLCWLIMFLVIFMNTFKGFKSKILGFVMMGILGVFFGGIGILIPTILNPWVNYIGYPILQLVILIISVLKSNSANKEK